MADRSSHDREVVVVVDGCGGRLWDMVPWTHKRIWHRFSQSDMSAFIGVEPASVDSHSDFLDSRWEPCLSIISAFLSSHRNYSHQLAGPGPS
jgi:hypothetical protein